MNKHESTKKERLEQAKGLLLAGDYHGAVRCLKHCRHLDPDCMEVTLRLGLAHLMAGDEKAFSKLHRQAAVRVENGFVMGGYMERLWLASCGFFNKVTKVAAIVALSTVSLAACSADVTPEEKVDPVSVQKLDESKTGSLAKPAVSNEETAVIEVKSKPVAADETVQKDDDVKKDRTDAGTAPPSQKPENVVTPPIKKMRMKYRVMRRDGARKKYGIRTSKPMGDIEL